MIKFNSLFRGFLIGLFSISCAFAQGSSNHQLEKNYPATLNFNGTEWKIDFADKNSSMLIVEYVTDGENVKNWKRLFTYQELLHKLPEGITPKQFAENIEGQIKEMKLEGKFTYLESSDTEAIFEFQIMNPKDQQQDEIQRIILGKDRDFYVIHYVERKPDMGDAKRKEWIENLKGFKVPLKK